MRAAANTVVGWPMRSDEGISGGMEHFKREIEALDTPEATH
jgi:hypothetical protein